MKAAQTDALSHIGGRVRLFRERKKLTQRELSARAGIGRSTLANIETGSRAGSVRTLAAIAEALGCNLSTLMKGTP